MINEHRNAITVLAGDDLYAKIETFESECKACGSKNEALQAEHDRLQAQVSELKALQSNTQDRLNQRLVECSEAATAIKSLRAAYALLKKAIDKKAIVRSKASFVSQVKEAYAEAEKVMGAK